MPMDIEVFTAGCHLCNRTVEMVKKVIGPRCTLTLHNLAEGKGLEEAEKYKIRTVPTIIGNGRKMFEGVPEYNELLRCSLEHGCKGRLIS